MEGKRSSGFSRIFTVAFLLFLASARGSKPVGQSLKITQPKITYQNLL